MSATQPSIKAPDAPARRGRVSDLLGDEGPNFERAP